MRRPEKIEWDLPISESDFEKLKKGFKPTCMEDHWAVQPTYLRESNAYSICWTRSWTGDPHYVLIIARNLSSAKGPTIQAMIYESFTQSDINITAEMAKQEVICLSRGLLRCGINAFPEIDRKKVFHYPKVPVEG
jgi:hypothetical protein